MTPSPLSAALDRLTDIQREAVYWDRGPLLVLAGPGSGKTQVLTSRIAQLLEASRGQNFRVLALTFTNKAADEMRHRVSAFVPGLEERATIATFHGFCAQVLRQHGVHIGINSDFTIYSTDSDRQAVMEDALARAQSQGEPVSIDDVRYLPVIDQMKARLVGPDAAEAFLAGSSQAKNVAIAYLAYEQELRSLNALDFNSLILETSRLVKSFPAIASRYQKSYVHWLVDEFQDTNSAQYSLLKNFAGSGARNMFAVADDDQIIYAWNGASYKQIQAYLSDFRAEVVQLPTNYRCPPAIVEAANRLVVYNAQRTASKRPLLAGKVHPKHEASDQIRVREFDTAEAEAIGVAQEIARSDRSQWDQTAVLARTKALLDGVNKELRARGVPAGVAQRRDDFLSPELRWLVAVLRQTARPLDRRNLSVLVDSFNRVGGITLSTDQLLATAESSGFSYLATWLVEALKETASEDDRALLAIASDGTGMQNQLPRLLQLLESRASQSGSNPDLAEDLAAWKDLNREITTHIGRDAPLDQFLQELQLRSKEPPQPRDFISLMTIHGAKGREFDYVYVIGLAEDVMPSFQSRKKGDRSPEMEEERRNCFVAITRTKECLLLSRAKSYRGWAKAPSRFLVEMGLVADH